MPIAIISVPVSDPGAARDFYVETLEFELLRDEPMGPEMRWIQLRPKTRGSTIALTTWFEGMRPGGLQGVMLHVPDIEAEHADWPGSACRCRQSRSSPGAASRRSRTRTAMVGSSRSWRGRMRSRRSMLARTEGERPIVGELQPNAGS